MKNNGKDILVSAAALTIIGGVVTAALAGTNLLHFDTDTKCFCQYFDQLAEVYPFVRNIVENGFITISLIFNVSYFHIQIQAGRYLA